MAKENTVEEKTLLQSVWEYTKIIVVALLLASVLRAMLYEPYKIPSSSMVPTLLVGDYLFVNKYGYGWRNPCTGERGEGAPIQRGDIVVFQKHKPYLCGMLLGLGSLNFIKRVVAVPGDTVEYKNKTLIVNGEPLYKTPDGFHTYENGNGERYKARKFIEKQDNIQHSVLLMDRAPAIDVSETTVPAGKYVTVGDNRDNSLDSRFWKLDEGTWGYVDEKDIVGNAKVIFWSWNASLAPRFERVGMNLDANGG